MANPTAYVVSYGDSIQRIALALTGSEANWRAIAAYNALDWPYIVSDPTPYAPVPASGAVTVTGPTASGWTVPVGFLFGQPALPNGSFQVQYGATAAISGGNGTPTVQVPVACTQTGPVGNCGPGAITVLVSSGLPIGTTCANATAFSNGTAPKVLGPGATLLIPPSISQAGPAPTQQDWLSLLGGTSLQLSPAGDLGVTPAGSLAMASAAQNLLQNWSIRVLTQAGDMPLHPTFGTTVEQIAASGGQDVQSLILADIQEAIQADPRVQSVANMSIGPSQDPTQPTARVASAMVFPVGTNTALPLNVLLGGG